VKRLAEELDLDALALKDTLETALAIEWAGRDLLTGCSRAI